LTGLQCSFNKHETASSCEGDDAYDGRDPGARQSPFRMIKNVNWRAKRN
jgi:hypothetical protein